MNRRAGRSELVVGDMVLLLQVRHSVRAFIQLAIPVAAFFAGSNVAGAATPTTPHAAVSAAAPEQVPASAYARAEAVLRPHIGKLIPGMSVRPRWIGETSSFWYEKQTRDGRDYVLVDAVPGKTRPLFDHDALIGALAGATDKSIARADFQLAALRVDERTGRLHFRYRDKNWRYDPDARALTPDLDPAAQGEESPDGAWRAVVRDGNLFVISTKDGSERQLTHDGSYDAPYATPPIDPKIMIAQGTQRPAVPPVLSWSPDSRRIATFRLNQEGARRLALVQSTPPNGEQPRVFDYVYTLPGDTETALARGIFFEVETGKRTDMDLAPEPVLYYFGPHYAWSADSKAVFARITERGYRKLELFRVDAASGVSTLLSEDRADTYLDTWSHFWSYDDKADRLYWTADQTGYFQLYAIDPRTGARRPLTSGDWVVRGVAGTDKAGRALIVGTGRERGRDPYLRHLYAVSPKGGAPKLLTPEPLDHDVSVSPDGLYFVDNMSLIDRPTRSVLRRTSDGGIMMELGRADVSAYLAAGYILPEPFETLAADGKTPIYGAIFKPAGFDPAKSYPIIEEIYTGPHIAGNSPKSFEAAMTLRFINEHAQIGAIGVTVDGRGTAGRSRAFQQPAFQNLHAVGLDDHIAAIRAMAAKYPWMDADRVGVYGYSAGGYDVVRAMTERPDFYKVGLTGAGVQDNRLDKAWWNEQWMGSEMGPVWDANSNIHWASKLTGKLMIVHGELDENVPPANSLRLVDALMKANKDFEFLIFPNAHHSVLVIPYFHRRSWDFFVRELLGKTPPQYELKPFP
ncbi:S9 family peptidase [Sphingosinicella rhizophila]|uniref:DPP IV N-terminal domain-containing protein n=1 Tax=Sphingosinicella rhizophila TaxID=3050082 RepID=A0ABU3Q1S3_9SPHN|nr:DPP IV N-terminal domain-containing protein [Sphingosinicella sp. GR2756]MDT9597365.1 DPP IV N-terminal domain-containing protein [Sphingosinicella sp. GR2756]